MRRPPSPLVPPAPTVTIVLGHTTDLGIAYAQRLLLVGVRGCIDGVDAPLRTTLDSLRPAGRPVNPRDLGPVRRDDIRRRRLAAENVLAHLRDSNLTSRAEVMAVLFADQQERVAGLEEDARRHEAELAQGAPGEDRGTETGRRGGRDGRGGSGRP